MRIALVTDAWEPQVNGVVTTLRHTCRELARLEHAVHIATEGPLGFAARATCLRPGWRFTTSHHTHFPEYLRARWPIPLAATHGYLRWFHSGATRTLVATATVRKALARRRFRRLAPWSRGVDAALFRPVATPACERQRP